MTDIEVGRFGLRTFRIDRDGHLLPIGAGDRFDWKDGVCFAECKVGGFHRPPAEGCSCGIYSFDSLADLRSQYRSSAQVVAVIAPEGHARVGGNGTVSERARVVALWTVDEQLTHKVLAATCGKILPYNDIEQMISDYGLRFTSRPVDVPPARSAAKGLVPELLRSAAGIGWASIVRPIILTVCLALGITLFVDVYTGPQARVMTEPTASFTALCSAVDRFLLAVHDAATPAVVTLLLCALVIEFARAGWRSSRAGATAAIGRLFRHAMTALLRTAITPLIVVATYGVWHGRPPTFELVAWVIVLVVASSWSSGGALYHVLAGVGGQRRTRSVLPGPTFDELFENVPRHLRGGSTGNE